jgi:hypothetical protein
MAHKKNLSDTAVDLLYPCALSVKFPRDEQLIKAVVSSGIDYVIIKDTLRVRQWVADAAHKWDQQSGVTIETYLKSLLCGSIGQSDFTHQAPAVLELVVIELGIPHIYMWGRMWVCKDLYKVYITYHHNGGFAGLSLAEYLVRLGYGAI